MSTNFKIPQTVTSAEMIITRILSILPPVFLFFTTCAQAQTHSERSGVVLINVPHEDTGIFAESIGSVDSTAMLAAHNHWRSEVGVPDLTWSEPLAQAAQIWADHLSRNGCCTMSHSGGGYGENIYKVSSLVWSNGRREIQSRTPQQIVDGWASEGKDYDYENNTCNGICGHYTQIIWRKSKELGCAVAICPDKSQMWVCNYAPTGNLEGQRPY